MNAPPNYQAQLAMSQPSAQPVPEDDGIDLAEYWDILVDNRWLIAGITALAIGAGGAYAFLKSPVYESNLLIQVEDSSAAKSLLGDAADLFATKTAASAEMEILRSRMVLGQAVDNTLAYIDARPRYLPLLGKILSRGATELSEPGFLGFGGYVTGAEKISIAAMDVPKELEGTKFVLTALGGGKFQLQHPELPNVLTATVGAMSEFSTPLGSLKIHVGVLDGKPGAEFAVIRQSRLATIIDLQEELKIIEKGRQSGVIETTLQSTDATKLTLLLDEIGRQYVRQNVERRSAEAQKSLQFLDVQLPQAKRQLDQAEAAYNQYRNRQGTVALDEEAKLILNRAVDLQSKLLEAQQRRRELQSRFTSDHPSVRTLDDQIRAWNTEIASLNTRVRGMPAIQQDALRLERDVKVNNELYSQLRNSSLQLQLVKEGRIGTVRLIDTAASPEEPVKPRKALVLALAALLGLFGGVLTAIARASFFRAIRNPQEIEERTGLNVYSTIPLSTTQENLARKVASKEPGLHILVATDPNDAAVESLRSLRTSLQFAMLEAANNRILITGATPGVGKSFVSSNLAAVLASTGKRVVLVDADLRKGHLNQYFGLPRARGLSELIAGSLKMAEAARPSGVPNLDLITTGAIPPNPAELLLSGSFAQLLDQLSANYDIVLVDSAPVLAASDTLGIATHIATLLLVARAGETQLGELQESSKRLLHAGKPVTGVLYNALDVTRRHYGSYGYGGYRYKNYSYGEK
ncbi:polysaccharide biosynthesis tyrosine autokinase [Ramlibacter sp. PS3R-8]|uniref:polysaccharide biosynthesis tyrosine autokinase n=1 Tax=Ramlibacter sp. PS3R-8 TaxID=3133437 RepID=UPI0030957847